VEELTEYFRLYQAVSALPSCKGRLEVGKAFESGEGKAMGSGLLCAYTTEKIN
jgi:hypothetical protein